MQLLVSVANAADARAAVEGGADIIDGKDPSTGPLGAVTSQVFSTIVRAVDGAAPLSAALGDTSGEREAASRAAAFVAVGAAFVKIGFDPAASVSSIQRLLTAVQRAAPGHIVAVAYADSVGDLTRRRVLEAAVAAGTTGMLLDTMNKQGPGLCGLLTLDDIHTWVADVQTAGLLPALAGRLTLADVRQLRDCGAAMVGVRSAACTGGREGRVERDNVRELRDACVSHQATAAMHNV
jgi:uncharacterized protein (UPF0264 family)